MNGRRIWAVAALVFGVALVSQAQVADGTVGVPDATATIILLGAAVIGLGVVVRRLA